MFVCVFVKGMANISGYWTLTWTVLPRMLDGSSWKPTLPVTSAVQGRGKVTSRSRGNAAGILAAIVPTFQPITLLDVDSSTSSHLRTERAPSTHSNAACTFETILEQNYRVFCRFCRVFMLFYYSLFHILSLVGCFVRNNKRIAINNWHNIAKIAIYYKFLQWRVKNTANKLWH